MRQTGQNAGLREHELVSRLHLACSVLSVLCALFAACTPIMEVSRDDAHAAHEANEPNEANDAATKSAPSGVETGAAGADGTTGSGGATSKPSSGVITSVGTAQLSSPCSEAGKRACASSDERTPLLCKDGAWMPQTSCSELERCETKAGSQLGTCVPIATECLTRKAGEDFCDGEFLQTCEDLVLTGARSCPERRRCKEVDHKARCVCAERWVETASGDCQIPSTCTVNNGGCDLTTSCDASSGQRVCGKCQLGFEGDGETGCHAQLSLLSVDDAMLLPAFSPDVHSYQLALPLLRQNIRVTAQTPPGVKLAFDAVELEPGSVWQSSPLPLGERKIEITLTTESGLKSTYDLTVTRSGAQEAYVKASNPGRTDEFGGGLALWGDTMAVGAPREDSASTDPSDNTLEDSGAVYVFVRQGNKWVQQQYLKASTPRSADLFGGAVALWDDMLFVGAAGANPVGSVTPHGGSVHVFKRQGQQWTLLTKLAPAGLGLQDMFGWSIVADAKRVLVGAPMDQSGERFSGAVYAFTRTGDSFSEPERIKSSKPVPSGLFGWSTALDGDTLVVGAPQFNNVLGTGDTGSGTAYVFTASGNTWTQIQELMPAASLEVGATMGWSVSVWGGTIAVGAPRGRGANEGQRPGEAFIYERASGGGWSLKQPLQATVPRVSDWFAWQLRLTPTALIIGSAGDNSGSTGLMADPKNDASVESGALYLYARDKDEWVSTTFIKTSNPGAQDDFGSPVAVSGDTFASGATGESSDAMGVDGNQASDALARSGAVYVFR